MATYMDMLSKRAFRVIPAEQFNVVRQEMTAGGRNPEGLLFYEVPLGEGKPWEYLRDKVYPMMARYLKAKKVNPETPDKVVVAVFHRDRCYLLTGKSFIEVFLEVEGLNPQSFHFRVLQWLSQ